MSCDDNNGDDIGYNEINNDSVINIISIFLTHCQSFFLVSITTKESIVFFDKKTTNIGYLTILCISSISVLCLYLISDIIHLNNLIYKFLIVYVWKYKYVIFFI